MPTRICFKLQEFRLRLSRKKPNSSRQSKMEFAAIKTLKVAVNIATCALPAESNAAIPLSFQMLAQLRCNISAKFAPTATSAIPTASARKYEAAPCHLFAASESMTLFAIVYTRLMDRSKKILQGFTD